MPWTDRKSTRLNSSHVEISYAVFCLKKKKNSAILGRESGKLWRDLARLISMYLVTQYTWRPIESTSCCSIASIFFFNDTATTEIYTLSLHDALPIFAIVPAILFIVGLAACYLPARAA